jgi:hypothetical protein
MNRFDLENSADDLIKRLENIDFLKNPNEIFDIINSFNSLASRYFKKLSNFILEDLDKFKMEFKQAILLNDRKKWLSIKADFKLNLEELKRNKFDDN